MLAKEHQTEASFRASVFSVVRAIPLGETLTYKDVAIRAGRPRACRAVGTVLSTNRDPEIPCHRVIRSDGTYGGYNRGAVKKKTLLEKERALVALERTLGPYYAFRKRNLPWRRTKNPYRILVSEIMLQQTQVPRVIQKYREFIQSFPTVRALHEASLEQVLSVWQGLGYNRRALFLKQIAKALTSTYAGKVPRSAVTLAMLPGIGWATAAAIATYVWNMRILFIETNVRTVFIHHCFQGRKNVTDAELEPFIRTLLARTPNPRQWYAALMDYGTELKHREKNPSRHSAHHVTHTPFRGSQRELRGQILRTVLHRKKVAFSELKKEHVSFPELFTKTVRSLERDGLLTVQGRYVFVR